MRINQLCGLWLSACAVLIAHASVWASEAQELVGKGVTIAHSDAAIYERPAADSRPADFCLLSKILVIREVRGDWVRADEGWLLARDVVIARNAKEFFTKAIEASPTGFALASRSWVRFLGSEAPDGVLADAEEAIRCDSDCALAFFVRAECKFKAKSYQEAVVDFTRAIELEPRFKSAYHERALCVNLSGRHVEAMDYVAAALDRWPNDMGLVEVRGLTHRANGKFDEAIADFLTVQKAERSESVDRHLALTYRARGEMRLKQQQFELAITDLTEAIKLHPKIRNAHLYRGEAHISLGRYEAATDDLQEAVRLDPNLGEARAMLGQALTGLGKLDEAIAQFNESIRLDSIFLNGGESPALAFRGRALHFQGNYAAAVRDLERAIKQDPNTAFLYAYLGDSLSALLDFERAIEAYGRAIELEPKNSEWRRRRGFTLCGRALATGTQEDFDRAIADCSIAIDLAPTSADAYSTRGSVFAFQDRNIQAVADFTKAIAINPLLLNAYEARADQWLALHEPARAIDDLTESLRISPNRPDVYLQRSKAWSMAGNQKQAAEDLADAERLQARLPEPTRNHDERRR